MISCNIAQKLSELRAARGLTQGEVAAALSVSDKTLSKWENGASAPDLDMLITLANYYGVTTDTLLGLSSAKQSAEQRIDEELRAADRTTLPAKLFSLVQSSFPAAYHAACQAPENAAAVLPPLPSIPSMPRCMVSTDEVFHFSVCSEAVNFAMLQLPNRANFAWLADAQTQAKLSRLLSLLSRPDAMTLLHFLYSRDCSDAFTVDYVAKNTALPTDCCTALLDELSDLSVCHKTVAHRLSGEIALYEFHGAGLVLSILSLAYEKTCGQNGYLFCYGGGGKMIGGERT